MYLTMNRQEIYCIFRTAFKDWLDDGAVLRAAALTFFIIIPLPTLLLIVLAIFSYFIGPVQAAIILIEQIRAVAGPSVAQLFNQLIGNAASPFTSLWTAIVVVGFSIFGAIGAFWVLRDTMDCIWEVKLPKKTPLWKKLRQKIVPFAIVSSLGLIVIAWTTIANSIFNVISINSGNQISTFIALQIVEILFSLGIAVIMLAVVYKIIPEATVHWQDVALAALVTSIAFTITNYIFGFYIQAFVITTVEGAAGALIIILLWIFVLNQIVLFGAEVTKVYAITVGTHSKTNFPTPVQRIVGPFQKAGEAIEGAIKEEVVSMEKPSQPEKEVVAKKGHTQPDYMEEKEESTKNQADSD